MTDDNHSLGVRPGSCDTCGQLLRTGWNYCPRCGTKIHTDAVTFSDGV